MRDLVEYWSYVSSKAGVDPVRSVIVLAPGKAARTAEDIESFCRERGWIEEVERSGDVLVAPMAADGWDVCDAGLPKRLYQQVRRSFRTPGASLVGRDGLLWAWECLIYVVGYGDGAVLAGNSLVAHPNFSAMTVLVDASAPCDLSSANAPSDHWFVPEPSQVVANKEVPVNAWLAGSSTGDGPLIDHLIRAAGATDKCSCSILGFDTVKYTSPENHAQRILITSGLSGESAKLARVCLRELFPRIIRWKSCPDGRLALHHTRDEFYEGGAYRHGSVSISEADYRYAVYLPQDMRVEEASGLPLVVSLHGRGEPAWLFAQKNGWEDLADETRAFAVLLPDSPGNLWVLERDADAVCAIVRKAVDELRLDPTRVYLTGFSNGAVMTYQLTTTRPTLFAAASAWNSPGERACRESGLGTYVVRPGFGAHGCGCEMPLFACSGDSDDKAPADLSHELAPYLAANGCAGEGEVLDSMVAYPTPHGYHEAARLSTTAWSDGAGRAMVVSCVVRDMPHGAIADEARAAWEFMSRFSRPFGSLQVEEDRCETR